MDFKRDVKVLTENEDDLRERLWVSDGTTEAVGKIDDYEYEPLARKPKPDWRKPTTDEFKLLSTSDKREDAAKTIGLVSLPMDIRADIVSLGIPEVKSYAEIMQIRKRSPLEYLETMDKIYAFKSQFLKKEEGYHKIDVNVKMRQRETLTIDLKKHYLTGLHFDAWEFQTMDKAQSATNRICLNLGKKDRYFVFLNLTLKSVYEAVQSDINIDISKEYDKDPLAQQFLTIHPEYPVVKVKVKPFEGYIAPTENIIHDGSSMDMYSSDDEEDIRDVTLTTRGYFSLFPLNQVV